MEIKQLEAELTRTKAQSQDTKHEEGVGGDIAHAENESALKIADIAKNGCEIAVLKRSQLFGEACVLEPQIGTSLGTVMSDTGCRVFLIHKSHLQTFIISESILERVRQRAVIYPSDSSLVTDIEFRKDWASYKAGLMRQVFGRRLKEEFDQKVLEPMEFSPSNKTALSSK